MQPLQPQSNPFRFGVCLAQPIVQPLAPADFVALVQLAYAVALALAVAVAITLAVVVVLASVAVAAFDCAAVPELQMPAPAAFAVSSDLGAWPGFPQMRLMHLPAAQLPSKLHLLLVLGLPHLLRLLQAPGEVPNHGTKATASLAAAHSLFRLLLFLQAARQRSMVNRSGFASELRG